MKKVNVELPNKQWGTIKTKYPSTSDLVSYDELTNESKNFDTTVEGIITKRSGGIDYNATAFSAPPKDQYEAIFNDGVHHLLEVDDGNLRFSSGGGTFTLVTAGYSSVGNFEFANYQDRVYFGNGINPSQVYDRTSTYGGVAYTVPQTKVMGAQAPTTAPTGAVVAGGNIPAGGHTYKITFLYYDLEESNGGPATGTITTTPGNQTVNLSSLPIGGYGVTARKIYRDNTDGVWLLVGTVANNTATTFSDTASIGTASIPTTNNTPPAFKYIIAHLDRIWIAGIPGDPFAIYFSQAGLPNIFPPQNRIACNPSDPTTGLYVYNDKPWVFNRNTLGSILGTTSDEFRYSALPSSVGCVDNRSIQVRTTTGIPTMIWLSSKGVYGTNGSSVQYLSDPIEDLVNLNIQQASQVKGQNAQTTQSQFTGGTSSPGIDLTSIPGTITTPNPKIQYDNEAEWEAGTLVNVATNDGSNTMSIPTQIQPTLASGVLSNLIISSNTLQITTRNDNSGESLLNISDSFTQAGPPFGEGTAAQPLIFNQSGTINDVIAEAYCNGGVFFRYTVWSDIGGLPGAILYQGPNKQAAVNVPVGETINFVVTAGVRYWIGYERIFISSGGLTMPVFRRGPTFTHQDGQPKKRLAGGTWVSDALGTALSMNFTFTQTPVAQAGLWTSQIYDTFSDSAVAASITQAGTFPGGTTGLTTVEASNDSTMLTGVSTQTYPNLNGTSATALSNFRYWRFKTQLTTADDRTTPVAGPLTFKFNTTGTWTSGTIDHTTDVVSLDSLVLSATIPGGTTAIIEIATSANDITYTAFGSLGSAVVQRYSKLRVTMTTDAGNTTSPTVSSVLFTWTLTANLQSSIIDTGNVPAGWDIFQSQFADNGGTINFFFRTAATAGAIPAATYIAVTNGQFPTNSVFQFAQWKVVITSSADDVPTVDSVTINWFIAVTNSIRVASIFYNRAYYLAAAEYNQTTNNVIIVWDGEGSWRIYRGINANTLGYFFNEPYYGSSLVGRFVKFLQSNTDQGTPIEMIVDTKSIEFEDPYHTKILRKLYLSGKNTGAAYQVSFSLDGGNTFNLMIDEATGNTTFQTSSNALGFYRRFIPNFQLGQPTAGKQIMFRITENTEAAVSLEALKAEVWIRSGELFENADVM